MSRLKAESVFSKLYQRICSCLCSYPLKKVVISKQVMDVTAGMPPAAAPPAAWLCLPCPKVFACFCPSAAARTLLGTGSDAAGAANSAVDQTLPIFPVLP